MDFFEFMTERFPRGMSYSDARNLCVAMFCVERILPDEVRPVIWTGPALACAFSELARRRIIDNIAAPVLVDELGCALPVEDVRHWVSLMDGVCSKGLAPDVDRALKLIS